MLSRDNAVADLTTLRGRENRLQGPLAFLVQRCRIFNCSAGRGKNCSTGRGNNRFMDWEYNCSAGLGKSIARPSCSYGTTLSHTQLLCGLGKQLLCRSKKQLLCGVREIGQKAHLLSRYNAVIDLTTLWS